MQTTDKSDFERKSSAVTLSDMEIFVFPELMYAGLLANIMSPRIWRWRNNPWFKDIERMKPVRRMQRLKQFIIENYSFNLDLNSWGLTNKHRELARFRDIIDLDALRRSNALFGYEGDKHYFDLDIRTHFGLDKYDGDIIPYWKTETVEAMDAFRFRPGFDGGAGECVSLAMLYAAAAFIVCRIPIDQIFLVATPLHSQNFLDIGDGILTNNRRLVTKNMWFNGSALSAQARRALENEQVTIVAHVSGFVHTFYDTATIDRAAYQDFSKKLRSFLITPLNVEILGNFLRHRGDYQPCFQLRHHLNGKDHFLPLERAFAYEPDSSARITDNTRAKLLGEIDAEEFSRNILPDRIILNDLEDFIRAHSFDLKHPNDLDQLRQQFSSTCLKAAVTIESLIKFCRTTPSLPDLTGKQPPPPAPTLLLDSEMTRDDVIERLKLIRAEHPTADLAFYAYRDLNLTDDRPFLRAAVERNPVVIEATSGLTENNLLDKIQAMPNESIYDDPGRLAQPDEAWNFGRGDGVEKALLLTACLRARHPDAPIEVRIESDSVMFSCRETSRRFASAKKLTSRVWHFPLPSN